MNSNTGIKIVLLKEIPSRVDLIACFSWALIQFKLEEKQYPADQDRDPLGLLSAVMSEHHSHKYQMKSSVKSVMQTCIFLFLPLFAVCLYIVSKSCLQSSHTSEPLSRYTFFMCMASWLFFPNVLLEKTTGSVLFGQDLLYCQMYFFFFFVGGKGRGGQESKSLIYGWKQIHFIKRSRFKRTYKIDFGKWDLILFFFGMLYFIYYFKNVFLLHWRAVDLQSAVGFWCTSAWISHR